MKYISKLLTFLKLIFQKARNIIKWVFYIPSKWPRYKKILIRLVHVFILFILFLGLVDMNFLWLFGKSPKLSQINDPKQKTASELYAADGKMIGKYFDENRTPIKLSEVSPLMIKTLINTEDVRFYEHHGIDLRATFSIFWYMIKGEKRGGSTITQQLVKNLFKTRNNYSRGLFGHIPGVKTAIYKAKEWITSLKIELFYSKDDILTMYFNTVDFGSNAYGIKTAARTFFNIKPSQLNIEQSALLVGMLKAPTYYSPISHADRALERRNTVLGQLLKYKMITQNEHDSILQIPILLNYSVENNYDGKAPYFREAVSNYLKAWLKEKDLNLYEDGLKIYTSLDMGMQQYAEEAMDEHMKRLQKRFFQHWEGENPWRKENGEEIDDFVSNLVVKTQHYKDLVKKFPTQKDSIDLYLNQLRKMRVYTYKGDRDTLLSTIDSIKYYNSLLHAGFITMDPNNGYVKTYIGGINFNSFKFDHVMKSKRQPGSTFKAFVYTAAMDNGYAPCDQLNDVPVTYNYVENGKNKSWSPSNADWVFTGSSVTLKYAFAKSINSIAVQLTQKLGWQKVIEYAYKLGIKTKLADVPSVCLGSSDVSLFELITAYCPLNNEGYKIEPILVTKITDKKGRVLYEMNPKKERVISEETAFLMNQMLQGGLHEPGGTTQALFEYDLFADNKTDFGGKTGTSSNHSDGWFIGVTPDLISASWVGADNRSVHFRTSELGEGCKTALPIYGLFMEKLLKDPRYLEYKKKYPKPKIKINKNYSCHTYFHKNDSTISEEPVSPQQQIAE
ncbi:MAG: transglycosylase domain-containing protein [Bacteroidetes bacterium]|nr:transglycosylase domain-containing protein [Bacteroidota bacterium]